MVFKVHPQRQQHVSNEANKYNTDNNNQQDEFEVAADERLSDTMMMNNKHTQRSSCCSISLRYFLVLTISILIILCSITIYVSVFIGLYTSIDELSNKVVMNAQDKIVTFLDGYMGKLKLMAQLGAQQYNSAIGIHTFTKDLFRSYMFHLTKQSGVFVGYFLYFHPYSERYAVTVVSTNNTLVYTYQNNRFPGIIRDQLNWETGSVMKANYSIDPTPANLTKQEFYVSGLAMTKKLKSEGVFLDPVFIIGAHIALPYIALLYDPIQLQQQPSKKVQIGMCRCTVPLYLLSNFLRDEIEIFSKGYVIIISHPIVTTSSTSSNNTSSSMVQVIAGSITTTTPDGKNTLPLFNLTERNAGKLMQDIYHTYRVDFFQLPEKFKISSLGVNYIIMLKAFSYENIKYKLLVVVYEDEVSMTTYISIGASLGATILVVILGICYGIVLSHAITSPIQALQRHLERIKVLDLEDHTGMNNKNSIFKEMNEMCDHLQVTISWLKEIKCFIPDNVFHQLQMRANEHSSASLTLASSLRSSTQVKPQIRASHERQAIFKHQNKPTHENHQEPMMNDQKHETASNSSVSTSTLGEPSSLFKMGLFKKTCTVICVCLNWETACHSDIACELPKIVNTIRSMCKVFQAIVHISSVEEIVIIFETEKQSKKKKSALAAVECALKIIRTCSRHHSKQSGHTTSHEQNSATTPDRPISMGISTSEESYVGNLGSHSFRFYSIISNATHIAKDLAFIARSMNATAVMDEKTYMETNKHFVSIPVDRMWIPTNNHASGEDATTVHSVCSVYELLREMEVKDDEWLYELEQKDDISKFQQLHSLFDIFQEQEDNKLEAMLRQNVLFLRDHTMSSPSNRSYARLLKLFEFILNSSGVNREQSLDANNMVKSLIDKYYLRIQRSILCSIENSIVFSK
ncbi:hypothetical protein C9374_013960 [Naegleria lovaniensis]|uniref:Uncharacterized protein n=1 Tax=Naegleria lovaniensis TaxID=51637 RepID=A0AA88GYI7_NAELO|nr:uncharacterized protein C9374_013960 [Naegleria lovaniensis]KAG2389400.1 hypothetical protein C9374_013960 [Naegleria lovaniensis]